MNSSVEMKVNHGKYLATSQVASALIIIQCSITREETIFHQYSEQYYHNAQFVLIPDSEVYDAVASLAALGKSRLAIATIILKKTWSEIDTAKSKRGIRHVQQVGSRPALGTLPDPEISLTKFQMDPGKDPAKVSARTVRLSHPHFHIPQVTPSST